MKTKSMKILIITISSVLALAIALIGITVTVKNQKLDDLAAMSSADLIEYIKESYSDATISIAVTKNGETEYYVYGKDNETIDRTDSEYEIGSISKTFLALLVSKAIKEGKLNLSDSISEYLDLDTDKYYPTIERLLTHTSGYKAYYFDSQMIKNFFSKEDNDFYGISKEKILAKVKSVNLKDKDYGFVYSNFGISVLGLVLESIYDKDYTTLVNDYIKNDLGLQNTICASSTGNMDNYWSWDMGDGYIPAGAIISNISDMAGYLNLYLTSSEDYVENTYSILKTVTLENSTYNKLGIKVDSVGMTWMIDSIDGIVWHNGGTTSFNSYLAFNKEENAGVVALSNLSPKESSVSMTILGIKIMKELLND
ncbi:MAG: beta-lactamase family protein [Bacillales bacterium]|nr:beta-lactamase family protein [Bacillales bacterium]